MDGKTIAHTHARLMGSVTRFLETPNAVIAALAVSACVTGGATWVVISKSFSFGGEPTLVAMDDSIVREAARQTARLVPSLPAATVDAIGFADQRPARQIPGALYAPQPETWTTPRQPGATRIIAGQPSFVPPMRPIRTVTALAPRGPQVVTRARGLDTELALRLPAPTPRPQVVAAEEPTPQLVAAAVSPRPQLRPVTLSTRAPAPEADDVVLTTASLADTSTPAPRLSNPLRRSSGSASCGGRQMHDMPRRPGNAAAGSAVMAAVGNGSGSSRDNALVAEALRGNMPNHMRELHPVTFDGVVNGRRTEITICVTPDYLSIGSDNDQVRVPMGLPGALRVADGFDMMLPTTRMVDAIYSQADVRLSPQPMTPGNQMSSTDYFLRHDRTIDGQMSQSGARGGMLVAGHKKDVVLANRLARAPGRVAIYGWHRSNGNPIQPLSTVHGEYYADYSHGIRLVSRTAFVDGQRVDLRSLLTDGRYAALLNGDGPLTSAAIRLASLQ